MQSCAMQPWFCEGKGKNKQTRKENKKRKISKKDYSINLASSYSNLLSYSILQVDTVTKRLKVVLEFYKYLTILVEKRIISAN